MKKAVHTLREDLRSIMTRDPAARNRWEVLLCYPGFHSVQMHRIAHWLYTKGFVLVSRMVSMFNRFLTGIDIHPGAKIGKGLFIDHGMGVVIGETAEIGDYVTIYQGATLGGTGKESGKRHPTIGDHVVISSGAKILGPFKVGEYSKIGSGSVVLKEVPPHCTVVGVPGKVVRKNNSAPLQEYDLDQVRLPDPQEDQLRYLIRKVDELEKKLSFHQQQEQQERQERERRTVKDSERHYVNI